MKPTSFHHSLLVIGSLMLVQATTWAQNTPATVSTPVASSFPWQGVIELLMLTTIGLSAITFLVSVKVLVQLRKILYPEIAKEVTLWQAFWGLKPLAQEKDLILEDEFDGIRELNNPIPVWFNVLFGVTIVFAAVYMPIYHVWGIGDLQDAEYEKEMYAAKIQQEEYLKKVAALIDENNVKPLTDAKSLAEGKALFVANCASCHGQKGEGGIGPNLTDPYWLHGGSINHVFKTVKEGVPSKGMIAWNKKLNPLQIQRVSSYILTLQGSNPPNAKEPQGEKFVPESSAIRNAKKQLSALH